MSEKLSRMQKSILGMMAEHGPAAFTGRGARKYGSGMWAAASGGIIIRAYSSPQFFLERRGLIVHQPRKGAVVGTFYKITPKGKKALAAGAPK